MPRPNLTRILGAMVLLCSMTGCATTSQPVAQGSPSKAAKTYYTEDTPQTGSHIARRYAVDDPNKPADPTADTSTAILVNPTLAPKVGQKGN